MASLTGALENVAKVVPSSLPYPIQGGIIRGVRTGIAFVLAGIATSIADGSLIKEFSFLPAEYAPAVTLALTAALSGLDKWLREKGLVDQAAEDAANVPLSDSLDTAPSVVPPAEGLVGAQSAPADNVNPTEFDDPTPDKL